MHSYVASYRRSLRLLLWNEAERRPRAFLRIYLFFSAYTILFIAIPLLVAPDQTGLLRTAGLRGLLLACTLGLLVVAAQKIDRRAIRSYGLNVDRQWVVDAGVGFPIGFAIPVGAALIGLAGGWITVSDVVLNPPASIVRDFGVALLMTLITVLAEELVFRGYILTNAIEGLTLRGVSPPVTIAAAWGVSALLFAVAHPAPSLINGLHFLGAGLLLGLAYLHTGQLALPIGIHTGFNVGASHMFSTAHPPSEPAALLIVHGPAWLAPQTGPVQTGLLIPAAIVVLLYVWWRRETVTSSPS